LDPEQNNKFMDHYLDEEYDLSKVMFITTANYLDQIPTELQDRLEVVELSSYTEFEKVAIAKTHLISKELKEHGLSEEEVTFTDAALLKIVRNYTKEAGVRDLERVIASILRKIVMDWLLNKKTEACVVEEDDIETYLGKVKYLYNDSDMNTGRIGVVNGLAYTSFGGDLLPIEATSFKGKGELILTGKLGEVMKESAMISLSYIKAHAEEFHIDPEVFETSSIHIHVPEGAVPKDGPSAGVTLTTALLSLFTKTKVSPSVAMTGEMTLQGKVLPIGGLKEKSIGAHRGGVRKIFIPRLNEKDLEEIPDEIRKDTKFVLVDQYQDIYKELFKGKRRRVKDEGTIQLLYN
ncbi:MAG: magnesium chelatase domain-containing protein, partial [Firmicutes bacterium]|nr:magnesium chelatase domain-containing protein [Bacillota bacterium]